MAKKNKANHKKSLIINVNGSSYVDLLISIFIIILVLALAITTLPPIIEKNTLNRATDEICRYIEISGNTSDVDKKIKEICKEFNISISDYHVNAKYFNERDKSIQLGQTFTVMIETKTSIGLGGLIKIPVRLKAQSLGVSEVYWK